MNHRFAGLGQPAGRPYVLLLLMTLYAYYPFLTSYTFGETDALWYQNILHDALIQFQHGIFPTFIGQSDYNYFGITIFKAPYFILLGQFLNLITFSYFSATTILHLTVMVTAIFASSSMYFVIRKIAPNLRFTAVALAFFYVSCPGVIGVIAIFAMYFSFMALPFIPLFLYSLVLIHREKNLQGFLLAAMSLAATLLAHAPIALLLFFLFFVYSFLRLVLFRKGLLGTSLAILLIIFLCAGQFVSLLQLGSGAHDTVYNVNASDVIRLLKIDIPGVFLPLNWNHASQTVVLQLGYSLWAILFFSVIVYLATKKNFLATLFFSLIFLLLAMLYPLPLISKIWFLVPQNMLQLFTWPMQRFYLVLAPLIIFFGVLVVANKGDRPVAPTLLAVMILGCGWNIYQLQHFHQMITSSYEKDNLSTSLSNRSFFHYGLEKQYWHYSQGTYEPGLKNKLLDHSYKPIKDYDIEQLLRDACLKNKVKILGLYSLILEIPMQTPIPVMQAYGRILLPKDKQQLLCIETSLRDADVTYTLRDNFYHYAYIDKVGSKKLEKQTVLITLLDHDPQFADTVLYIGSTGNGEIKTHFIGSVSYDLHHLPIQTITNFPFKAHVTTPFDQTYLEVFKAYYPGYVAHVNGAQVNVSPSPDNLVMIPLQKTGKNQIDLVYEGTTAMRWSVYFSMLVWIVSIVIYGLIGKLKTSS